MIVNRSILLLFTLIHLSCYANINHKLLPKHADETLQEIIAQCSLLAGYQESTLPQDLYDEVRETLQHLIETVDPKEKNVRELTQRNEKAQSEALHRVITEKKSQEMPLLSFVIPCYNRAGVINQTIESIYNQNLTVPFEVIAVDDASTDNSFEVLQAYEKKYDNFFAYKNEVNKKAPTTRNVGMLYARGKYICNADSDDVFGPNTIMPMLTAMMEKNYDACYFQDMIPFYDVLDRSLGCAQSCAPQNEFDLTYMLGRDVFTINCGNRIFTKKSWLAIGGYLEEKGHDSWSFSFRMHAHGYIGYIHPTSLNYFRMWRNKSGMWQQDNMNKVNDVSPLKVARENLELFTEDSQRNLLNYGQPDGVFIMHYSKTLTTLPREPLYAIFDAYKYEDAQDYMSAYLSYERAQQNGATHPILYLKQLRAAINARRFDLVLDCHVGQS